MLGKKPSHTQLGGDTSAGWCATTAAHDVHGGGHGAGCCDNWTRKGSPAGLVDARDAHGALLPPMCLSRAASRRRHGRDGRLQVRGWPTRVTGEPVPGTVRASHVGAKGEKEERALLRASYWRLDEVDDGETTAFSAFWRFALLGSDAPSRFDAAG